MKGVRNMKRMLNLLLCMALLLTLACPALAVESQTDITAAAGYMREKGIMTGDANGDLMLDKGLTRVELAVLLTQLHGEGTANPNLDTWACYFDDVPAWAKPYVGYCITSRLVSGYDSSHYGPNDMVTPAMACTVILRCCGYKSGEGSTWSYNTACDYAVDLGLISQSTAQSAVITRGEMAVLICRAMGWLEYVPPTSTVTGPYTVASDGSITISQTSWSREDFSQQANPAVFTGFYTRELYNTIRQTMVDGEPGPFPAYTMVAKGNDYKTMKSLIGRMEGIRRYEHYVPQDFTNYWQYLDYFAVSADMPENYQAPLDFIQPVIAKAEQMGTDREKVTYLNDYLCTLLAYEKDKASGITRTFAPHTEEIKAACGSYAVAFKFLCAAVDIPCFTVNSTTHTWNMVYVDNQWLHVDVATNDLNNWHYILLAETVPNLIDCEPEATAFLKELFVPGSTK